MITFICASLLEQNLDATPHLQLSKYNVHYSLSVPKHRHLYAYAIVCCAFNIEHLCVPMHTWEGAG